MSHSHSAARSSKVKTSKKPEKKETVGKSCRSIRKEVTLDIKGVTELMKACYFLDVELVQTAVLVGEDMAAVDAHGNDATKYLFAGCDLQMERFRKMHPGSDHINLDRMSERDRKEYRSLTDRMVAIVEILSKGAQIS